MSDQTKVEKLKKLKIFEDFDQKQLEKLAPLCEEVEYPARTNIFNQYDPATDVYAIVGGEVSLVYCDQKVACRQLGLVKAGEMMGWSPLVGRRLLSDTAHTNTPVTALRFDGDKMLEFCQQNPEFGFEFMRRTAVTLAERLSATRMLLMEVHGMHLPEVQVESD
jgi:CRP-like cAMP-binding protein